MQVNAKAIGRRTRVLLTLCLFANSCFGQEAAQDAVQPAGSTNIGVQLFESLFGRPQIAPNISRPQIQPVTEIPIAIGETWVTVMCGLPGDAEHRERLTEAIKKFAEAAPEVLGYEHRRFRLLVGDTQMVDDLADVADCNVTTAETIASTIKTVSGELAANDSHWLFVFGHGNLYGKRSLLNIEGPDIDQTQFGEMIKPITCRRSVVWMLQPASGFWLQPMAGSNTVLISATEAGNEITATEMPYALADVLAGDALHQSLEDIDKDSFVTMLDLYLAVNIEVAARFSALEVLQTEHAQLDDNGDGRGKELQQDFLPDAPESRFSMRNTGLRPGRDGSKAKAIPVYLRNHPKSIVDDSQEAPVAGSTESAAAAVKASDDTIDVSTSGTGQGN